MLYLSVNNFRRRPPSGPATPASLGNANWVSTPGTITSTSKWQPFDDVKWGAFYVDGRRHMKPSATKLQTYNDRGLNMLFCDGHAAPVSVKEAWNAIHNPGSDQAGQ